MELRSRDFWAAIDEIAAECGLTASGLARTAGLDPTTFNKSKRVTKDGHERWPGNASVARVLSATGTSFIEFAALVEASALQTRKPMAPRRSRKAPVVRPRMSE